MIFISSVLSVVGFCCVHMHCGFQTGRRAGLGVLSGTEGKEIFVVVAWT
jgi:hypothetical protein